MTQKFSRREFLRKAVSTNAAIILAAFYGKTHDNVTTDYKEPMHFGLITPLPDPVTSEITINLIDPITEHHKPSVIYLGDE
jgi:hypothetical protein